MKTKADKEILSVVHDRDFVDFLQRIHVYDDVMSGKCHCFFCNKQIDVDNISNVFSEKGNARFVCDDMQCIIRFGQYLTRKQ